MIMNIKYSENSINYFKFLKDFVKCHARNMNSFENHKINLQHTHESVTSLPNYPPNFFLYINNILVPSYDGFFFIKIIIFFL